MISLFNKKKSVLLFSLALVALPLWLSISFLTVAHSDKQDAGYLKNYVATDKAFRNASIQIAEERSTSYWLIGLDELINPEQPLVRPHSQSMPRLMRSIASTVRYRLCPDTETILDSIEMKSRVWRVS